MITIQNKTYNICNHQLYYLSANFLATFSLTVEISTSNFSSNYIYFNSTGLGPTLVDNFDSVYSTLGDRTWVVSYETIWFGTENLECLSFWSSLFTIWLKRLLLVFLIRLTPMFLTTWSLSSPWKSETNKPLLSLMILTFLPKVVFWVDLIETLVELSWSNYFSPAY